MASQPTPSSLQRIGPGGTIRRMNTIHRLIRKPGTVGLFLIALLSCSCATRPQPSAVGPGPELPANVTMNKDAGRGNHLYVTLRSESGEELPFMVDTGSPITILDRSLEPRLGRCLGTDTLWNFGATYEANRYAAPRLYLGSTPLLTDSNALTSDFVAKMASGAGRPILGILGMDCLQHYCLQLDFKAGKMRFLNPDRVKPARLGKAFGLTFSSQGNSYIEDIRPYIHHSPLLGTEVADVLIDTGYDLDGALELGLFRREIREHTLQVEADANDAPESQNAYLPKCVWSGATYTDLVVGNGGKPTESEKSENSLGLRFLARHLVTFDFPRRTMYLRQTSSGPLVDKELLAEAKAAAKSVLRPARKLMRNGQLPGWSKEDRGTIQELFRFHPHPDTITFDARKKGDSSTYHYEFTRASKDAPWKLQRAWRTDQDDRTIAEYPVP